MPSAHEWLCCASEALREETLERPLEEASEEECKTLSISLVPSARNERFNQV